MMKRLLWKIYREEGWLLLCWALSMLYVSLFQQGQTYCGEPQHDFSLWQILPLFMAFVAGSGIFGGMLASRKQTIFFLLSRPISVGMHLLAINVLVVFITFGVPILAALIFRATCLPAYRPFATPGHLVLGVWGLAWKMGISVLLAQLLWVWGLGHEYRRGW